MRPTDRFEHELPLNTFFGVNDEDVILGGCLSKRMRERGLSGPTPELKTVDDYVRFFGSASHGVSTARVWNGPQRRNRRR